MTIRTIRRRASLSVLAFTAASSLLLLAGCSGGGASQEDPDGPIQLWVRQAEDGLAVYEEMAAQYEDATGQAVEVSSVVNDFEQRLIRAASGDDLPDVVINDTAGLGQMVELGLVEPMDKDRIKGADDISDRAWEAATGSDGETYGVPFSAHAFLLLSRSDWREKVGLEQPETWEDLVVLADAFRHQDPDGNGQDDTYGVNVPASTERGYASWFWTTYLWQAGGDYFETHEDGTYSVTIDEPEAVESLDWLKSLNCDIDAVQPNFINTVTVDAHPNFASGLVGMYQTGPWMFARYDQDLGADKYEVLAPPAGPGEATVMAEGENSYVMANSPRKDAAIEFAAWLASEDGQLAGMNPGGYGVVRLPVNTGLDAGEVHDDPRWSLAAEVYEENGRYVPPIPNFSVVRQLAADTVNAALADCSSDSKALLSALAGELEQELETQGVLADAD